MKKVRVSKKVHSKETQPSQKSIYSFFAKQHENTSKESKLSTKKPVLEVIDLSDDDFEDASSSKKSIQLNSKLPENGASEEGGKRKFPLQKTANDEKSKDQKIDKRQKLSHKNDVLTSNSKPIEKLTRGKFFNDNQQRVPDRNIPPKRNENISVAIVDIYTSPQKKSPSPKRQSKSPYSKENATASLRRSPRCHGSPQSLLQLSQQPSSARKQILSPIKQNSQTENGSNKTMKDLGSPIKQIIAPLNKDSLEMSAELFEVDLSEQLVPEIEDMFIEDFEGAISQKKVRKESLNLLIWQRCHVTNVSRDKTFNINATLSSVDGRSEAVCLLKENWRELNIVKGDTMSIIARDLNEDGIYIVDSEGGLVVQWPDTLVSGTSVVGSLFCKRKSVLQEHFRGIDCNNKIMTIGSLTHELLQRVLTKKLSRESEIRLECEKLLKEIDTVYMLYGADLSYAEAKVEMSKFILQIVDFVKKYVANDVPCDKSPTRSNFKKNEDWTGKIEEIVDIEENIWSPHLGLKGKVDVTCKVTIHGAGRQRKLVPLELKTGKASLSAEHRGQVILYTMMMTAINNTLSSTKTNMSEIVTEGLLLYLRDKVSIQEIKAGHPERRDLMLLRNQLAYYLGKNFKGRKIQNKFADRFAAGVSREDLVKELATTDGDLELPEPINHHSACGNCAYLTLCSLYLRRDKKVYLNDRHPLKKLQEQAIGHLSEEHINYFIKWVSLLAIEETDKQTTHHLKDIWTVSPTDRELKGKCLANLTIKEPVIQSNGRFLHCFRRVQENQLLKRSQLHSGEYVVVSTGRQYAVTSGIIQTISENTITVLLERNLTLKMNDGAKKVFHIDAPSTASGLVFSLTNLGLLMDETDQSTKLRRIIIDRFKPAFVPKLPRRVADLGRPLLVNLNALQQKAVLKSIAANDYLLIRGMPGTGKSQTSSRLIELLVLLGHSVLVTSHTHSAVDNLLMRLVDKGLKMLRLGSSERVNLILHKYTEAYLTSSCTTSDELNKIFAGADVVGVTCLGSGHALLSKRQFDVCIVDESTQVLQCCILRPLFAAKKFILIGDSDQLPPIVKSDLARLAGMEESLFSRLEDIEDSCVSLSQQYRMNRLINELANRLTYRHKLTCANDSIANGRLHYQDYKENIFTEDWLKRCVSPDQQYSVVFLNTGCTYNHCRELETSLSEIRSKSCTNPTDDASRRNVDCSNTAEALVVLRIIQGMLKCGITSERLGIITPYRDQVALLKMMTDKYANSINLPHIEVNTVDQFQGRDKDVIIYSCVKSFDSNFLETYQVKDTEILQDHRRLTVAVTRAKYKLVMIGDTNSLSLYKPFKLLLEALAMQIADGVNFERDCLVSLEERRFSYNSLFNDLKSFL